MATGFNCRRCGMLVMFCRWVRSRMASSPVPERCPRCGTVHAVLRGEVERISPDVLPLDAGTKYSPWMLPWTRPMDVGWYHCRFTHTEPRVLTLWWDGARFLHDGQQVRMRSFLTWRGEWK